MFDWIFDLLFGSSAPKEEEENSAQSTVDRYSEATREFYAEMKRQEDERIAKGGEELR